MAKRVIDQKIVESIQKYIKKISKYYKIDAIILFGSYAKGTEHEFSDIDIAIVSSDFNDIFDAMAELVGMTWKIDTRIEPHPIKKKDFDEAEDFFIKEIIETGIKVA